MTPPTEVWTNQCDEVDSMQISSLTGRNCKVDTKHVHFVTFRMWIPGQNLSQNCMQNKKKNQNKHRTPDLNTGQILLPRWLCIPLQNEAKIGKERRKMPAKKGFPTGREIVGWQKESEVGKWVIIWHNKELKVEISLLRRPVYKRRSGNQQTLLQLFQKLNGERPPLCSLGLEAGGKMTNYFVEKIPAVSEEKC